MRPERRPITWRLVCSECGREFDPTEVVGPCHVCGSPVLVEHDLEQVRGWLTVNPDPARGGAGVRCALDFWPVLPLEYPARAVSLQEGGTPLYRLRVGPFRDANVWVKDESRNPTGTFKSRGMFVALNRLFELGVSRVVIPSAGNAASAASAYAASLGMQCWVVVPEETQRANLAECVRYGATVLKVRGSIREAGVVARKISEWADAFVVATLREPYRVEGKKTMGYELCLACVEMVGQPAPAAILYPTGGGTGLIGIWKAYREMRQLGWPVDTLPRLIAVQAEGCAPIVRAYREGEDRCVAWEHPRTIATGLLVPQPAGDRLILRAVRETGGQAVAIPDDQIVEAMTELGRAGYDFCPEAAACWAAYRRLVDAGDIRTDENVVLLNTGTGLKYVHLQEVPEVEVLDPERVTWNDVSRYLRL